MSKMVVVGCKLPNGLICELGKAGDENYKRVVLNGANSSQIIGGYGLTSVDEDFIQAWLEKFSWLDCVKQKLIFVQSNEAEASAQALDTSGRKTGLERLNPDEIPAGLEVDKAHLEAAKRDNIRQMTQGAAASLGLTR